MFNKLGFNILFSCLFFQLTQGQSFQHITFNNPENPNSVTMELTQQKYLYQDDFGPLLNQLFNNNYQWKLRLSNADPYGVTHHRYSQYLENIPVLGGELIVHEKSGVVISISGICFPDTELKLIPRFTKEQALKSALQHLNLDHRTFRSDLEGSENETRLVVMNENYPLYGGEMKLAYEINIHSHKDHLMKKLFMDAATGMAIKDIDLRQSCSGEEGKMKTLFHGEQNVQTEKVENKFQTFDLSRSSGIFMRNTKSEYYSDLDNFWEDNGNDYQNGAHDLYWGLQSTYDFYDQKFGRKGVDGNGSAYNANLLDTGAYNNAYWDFQLKTVNFGIGNRTTFLPFTSVDIVGHEITHGVTQFTANLEYQYESGALNESFSDIMGKAIERISDEENFDWLIGSKIYVDKTQALRSMEDPNRFGNPKYYRGKSWFSTSADNGGVHYNSGVLNYWYYLLVQGGNGKNEGNQDFAVKPMGFDTATQIAYYLLRDYLNSTSGYRDAMNLSLKMVASWWGICSDSYLNVAEAWKAVGLGSNPKDSDVQLVSERVFYTVCKDGSVDLSSRIFNNSCTQSIAVNTQFVASYQQDNLSPVFDTFIVDQEIKPGDYFTFKFKKTPVITRSGTVRFAVSLQNYQDADTSNNRYSYLVNRNLNATEHDFSIIRINLTGSSCPVSSEGYRAQLVAAYNGCSIIPPGTDFILEMKFNDSLVSYPFKNDRSLYLGLQFRPPAFNIPRNFLGYKFVQARLVYPKDTVLTNNNNNFQIIYTGYTNKDELEPFENGEYNKEKIQVFSDSFSISRILNNTLLSSDALWISGNGIFGTQGTLKVNANPDPDIFMSNNSKFLTRLYLCANIIGLIDPKLEFDLIQDKSDTDYEVYGIGNNQAVLSRIMYRNGTGQVLQSELIADGERTPKVQKISRSIPLETELIEIQNLALSLEEMPPGVINENLTDQIFIDNLVIKEGNTAVENADLFSIFIYPNPTNEELFIRFDEEKELDYITIIGLDSRVICIQDNFVRTGQVKISLEALHSGIYSMILKFKDGNQYQYKLAKL